MEVADASHTPTMLEELREAEVPSLEDVHGGTPTMLQMKAIHIPCIFILMDKIRFVLIWECIVGLSTLFLFWITSYIAFFSYYEPRTAVVVQTLELLYTVDIILRLSVEIWRHCSKSRCQIFILQYSFWQFLLDLIALFPVTSLLLAIFGTESFTSINYIFLFRFNRFARLSRAIFLFKKLESNRVGNETLVQLTSYLFRYFLTIHFFACLAYALNGVFYIDWILGRAATTVDDASNAHWLYLRSSNALFRNDQQPRPVHLYYLTIDFIVAIVTTVGYGDLYPLHHNDIILAIFIMVVGCIVLDGILSNITTEMHLSVDSARYDLFYRLDGIERYMKTIKAPCSYIDKVKEYYSELWNFRHGVHQVNLKDLPSTLIEEFMYDVCEEMFNTSPLFRDLESNTLHSISRLAKVKLYIPEALIIREGDYSTDMYYVIQGELGVRGKVDAENMALILRPGSILGEVNLLYSIPAHSTIQTMTTCQILKIPKQGFMKAMEKHPMDLAIIRQRLGDRFEAMLANYKRVGFKQVAWVQRKDPSEMVQPAKALNYPVSLRDSRDRVCNERVFEDIRDDSVGTYIVNMKCPGRSKIKDHFACYRNCNIENIFRDKKVWVQVWQGFIMGNAIVLATMLPYCSAFDDPEDPNDSMYCAIFADYYIIAYCAFLVDLIVEIYEATPSTGIYYRFRDGIRVSLTKPFFWFDVLAVLPWGLIDAKINGVSYTEQAIRACCKSVKVFRFICHMDNVFPLNLFAVRMVKALIVITYGCHLLACLFFWFVCNRGAGIQCNRNTWMSSYYRQEANKVTATALHEHVLMQKMPYLLSLWFATATFTSAGYGDFTPQRKIEVVCCIAAMIIGVLMVSYIIGGLAAALTCGVRPQILFQQRLLAIRIFIEHHNLSTRIKDRILEHYDLQNKMLRGIVLPPNTRTLLYDAPDVIVDDTLLWEVELFLEGVPIFTKCDGRVITRMAKLMKVYLVPPNVTYVDRGEVRRSMSIVYKGSVGIYSTDGHEMGILESTGHFGIRDLLFGEPHEYFIKTKSYCILYSIDFQCFIDSFEGFDEQMMDILHEEKVRLHEKINDLVFLRGFHTDRYDKSKEKPDKTVSFIVFPWRKSSKCDRCTHEEYIQTFNDIPHLRWLYRAMLLPIAVHPVGLFAKLWTAWISFVCMLTITCACVEFFMQFRQPWFRYFQLVLNIFNWMDIYIKLHWSYYGERKHLISHPAKTAYNYMFHGMFVYDTAFVGAFEGVINAMIQGTNFLGYGPGSNWFTKLRMTRCLQVYKVPELFRIVHNVFSNRTMVLCLFYCIVLVCLTTVMGSMAVYIACPWFPRDWTPGDEFRMPACYKESWLFKEILQIDRSSILQRWVISIYYIFQAILTVGFGEIVTLQKEELQFLIVITIIGFLLMQVIIADIMAAQIDTDENRAQFLEDRLRLLWCLKRERTPKKIIKVTEEHLNLKWEASRGLQPQEIFEELHPALAADLFQEFVGDSLINVPLFRGFSVQVLRSMAKLLKKQYFLEGDRITRCGNLEFEMFVVVQGHVYMLDSHGKYMTTLKKNDFFGEISMLFGKQRRYSAIAATKVELFVLNADDFADLIDKYPAVKDEILGMLKGDKREVFVKNFARKKHKDFEKWQKKAKLVNDIIGRTLKSRDVSLLNRKHEYKRYRFKCSRWIVGYGTEDLKLPFLYFANESRSGWRFKFLIHPNCMFWRIMHTTAHYVYFLSTMLTLYAVFFVVHFTRRSKQGDDMNAERILNKDKVTMVIQFAGNLMEMFVIIYMLLKFIVPYKLAYNIYCKDWGRIVLRYLTDPWEFLLDFIGIIHVEFILIRYFPTSVSNDEYFAFLQLVRLVRFYHNIVQSKDDLGMSTLRYKMAISGSLFLFMGHILACILYWAAVPFGQVRDPSWVSRVEATFEGIPEEELDQLQYPSVWYLRSLYFMMTILTSCGFGDNLPQSFIEYIFVCITMLCGVVGTAIAMGNLSTGLQALQKSKREYFYRIDTEIKHLVSVGLNKPSANTLVAYYNCLWEVGRGQPYHKATSILPLTMQFDYCAVLFGEAVMQCTIFGGIMDESFIRNVSIRLVHNSYPAGVPIVNQTQSGSGLYIVYKGIVVSYIIDDDGDGFPEYKRRYEKFQCFGHSVCLFRNMVYGRTYRAANHVETLYLDQADIKHIVRHYPLWQEYLQILIQEKYVGLGKAGYRHIFSPDDAEVEQVTELPPLFTSLTSNPPF